MRRRPKPAKPKVQRNQPRAGKSPKTDDARVRDRAKRLRDLEARLAESLKREKAKDRAIANALEQQSTTAHILHLIASSPTDLPTVLHAVAERAAQLCEATDVLIHRVDGAMLPIAAGAGSFAATYSANDKFPLVRSSVAGRAVLERKTIHVHDLAAEPDEEFSSAKELQRRYGHRTVLSTPLMKEGVAVGAIWIRRTEVRPFTDKQIKLLETFADQAVIAIENVRLFTELGQRNRDLTEALEQQTATGEILRVISSSPTDVQPVFDTIVESAMRLCEAVQSNVQLFDGEVMHYRAQRGISPEAMELLQRIYPMRPDRSQTASRAVLSRSVVHLPDVLDDLEYRRELALKSGSRSMLSVPMMREGRPIGAITVARLKPGAFSESQVALLQTFANQAVIAIENVRLFNETKEALEQQTATSEILRVIASSPTDVRPVFEAILKRAVTLCEAQLGHLWLYEGGEQFRLGAGYGSRPDHLQWLQQGLHRFGRPFFRESGPWRVGQVLDVRDTEPYRRGEPVWIRTADHEGMRTLLAVPLVKDGRLVGSIAVYRREVQPFTDQQTALVQIFADQAVIAIENVRLFKELETRNRDLTESLEQQTATSEVLRVISRSPTAIQPVLDTVAESAARLCESSDAEIFRLEADRIRLVAHHGPITSGGIGEFTLPLVRGTINARAMLEGRTVHVADLQNEADEFPVGSDFARRQGTRTQLTVPLMREGVAIGTISLRRTQVRLFTERHIELLKTFADQAVIAIENVRLFTELQASNRELTTALDTQTATSDILRVISCSQTDVQPVFDAIVTSAVRLLGAYSGTLTRIAGEQIELAAITSTSDAADAALRAAFPQALSSAGPHPRTIRDRAPLNITDAHTDPRLTEAVHAYARVRGYRSQVVVPLLRHDEAIGTISLTRGEPGGFTIDEIGLLQTFADQAVIAIENVRLFTELQTSNRDLIKALDTQTATSDILHVISRSPTDVQPVFDAIVRSAVRLLGGHSGLLTRVVGEQRELGAFMSTDPTAAGVLTATYPRPLNSAGAHGQAIRDRAPVNIRDMHMDLRPTEAGREDARVGGYRSMVVVPLLRQAEAIGALAVTRREPGGFTDDEIALLQTFADQAVIAIENARLLTELRARTQELTRSVEQLTALGEVGRAVSSTLDLEIVLTTIVSRAVQLSGLDGGVVFEYDEDAEEFVQRAMTQTGDALAAARRSTRVRKGEGVLGRTAITLEPVQVADIAVPGAYEGRLKEILIDSGIRAILAVPMVREGRLIGCLGVTRNRPGDFPAETIELLRTFATQSALAIQNARLFHEIADKSHQLEAASRHKSEFLANMSHELRTPLNAVIGFSEVLLQRMFGDLNDKQDEYLKDIYASGQHLLSLINDILDLSKIEAGRMELTPAPFHLPSALDNAVTLVRERAARHGITLQVDMDPALGEVVGDERKVKQVVLNLLSNAVKFTPEGGRISLKAARRDGMVEIAATDTGVGIAPEDQAAIFEEFRQVGSDEARKQEGTGLGLTLAKKFVELHGGRIWVESALGQGSTFTFTLPVS